MKSQIIADSCCDLTPALRAVLDIKTASLKINVHGTAYVDDGTVSVKALLADMKASKEPPATACPAPEAYAELMREADESYVITLSGKLSGSYNAAVVGRDIVLEEHPDKKICIIDSESAASGETLLAMMVRDALDAGMPFEDVCQKVCAFRDRMKTFFVLESLDNLVKNGRISKFAGFVGTMLNLRPIMGEDGHGGIVPVEKVRGTQNALNRLVDIVCGNLQHEPDDVTKLVISHCNCPERAYALRDALLEKCSVLRDVIVVPAGGISTVYEYDGGIVLAY